MKLFPRRQSVKRCCCVATLALLCGCSVLTWRLTGHNTGAQNTVITEGQAIAIAKRAVRAKNPDMQEVRARARFVNDRWVVSVNYIAGYDMFGLFLVDKHNLVVMDTSGKILTQHPGK